MTHSDSPEPRRKSWPRRHKFLTALAALAAIIIISVVASAGGGSSNPGSTSPGTSTSTSTSLPGIGTPVRDGKFQFTVTEVTHAKSVGGTYGDTAQGRYTILHVTVANIGDQSQSLDDSAQYVFDASGRKFDASTAADLDINGNGGVFLNDINPGNAVHGLIAFDMPSGDRAVKAELHDSIFSGGVTVKLS
jgi:Domain of unknown function (DUF4352)